MASIERTAYPRIKNTISQKELKNNYTLLLHEISYATSFTRGKTSLLIYLTLLKCFQNLGYFPQLNKIPIMIFKYINEQLNIKQELNINKSKNTVYTYHKSIREYLNIKKFDDEGKQLIIEAVRKNSYVMDNPADLINCAIDILIKNNYELPAYYLLDKLVLEVRTRVHNSLFEKVFNNITNEQKNIFDTILEVNHENSSSSLQYLKEPTKKTSFKNMKELIEKLDTLKSMGDFKEILKEIPYSKLKHFSNEIFALDIGEIKDYSDSKKYTMIISFLHTLKAKFHDNLIDMFLKCVNKANNKGQEELKKVQEKLQPKTENIISAFTELLGNAAVIGSNEEFGKKIRSLIDEYGGQKSLYNDCISINSYKDNNYYIFLNKLFSKNRKNIFKLFNILEFGSTTEDNSLIDALNAINTLYNKRKKIQPQEFVNFNPLF
jgi:hypothetical protein